MSSRRQPEHKYSIERHAVKERQQQRAEAELTWSRTRGVDGTTSDRLRAKFTGGSWFVLGAVGVAVIATVLAIWLLMEGSGTERIEAADPDDVTHGGGDAALAVPAPAE